jgi:hypothetical protein
MVVSSRATLKGVLLVSLAWLACTRGARTAEEAYDRFVAAIRAHDGELLYGALDLETRWSWMSIRRAQREAYDIVLSSFPEGPQRETQGRRFEAAALSENEAQLFASQMTEARWAELARGLPDHPRLEPVGPDQVQLPTADGRRLVFKRGSNQRWGYAGFAQEAEQLKRKTAADLELVRASAADLEQAASRSGR